MTIPLKNPPGGEYGPADMEVEVSRLMTAAKGGDERAFDDLVQRLRARAFAVANSLVGSREDAMDLAQEAFLKTYRARETFRDGEPFLPWFHRILRNTCFSFLRKHRRLKKHSISGADDERESDWQIAGDAPPPSSRVERDELKAAFWTAFVQLTARDREILTLRHFQELSYREIAQALEIPEGTVMSRLFHARRHLRDRLSTHLDGALTGLAALDDDAPDDGPPRQPPRRRRAASRGGRR